MTPQPSEHARPASGKVAVPANAARVAGAPHGIVLVDKSSGRTSHDVVARVRWLLGTKKVGHAGTLDPMATGLLVLGVGQGTRLLTYLVGLDKTYTATIRLGVGTTTDDAEGEFLGSPVSTAALSADETHDALQTLRGQIVQVPSTFSAIKVDGQRAYARARAGEDVELEARQVRIDRFDVRAMHREDEFLDLDVTVTCSSGTYVRALARDLGTALGVGGHLTALRRTHVGPFTVRDAVHIPGRGEGDDVQVPLFGLGEVARAVMPHVMVTAKQSADLGHGKRIERSDNVRDDHVGESHNEHKSEDAPVAALNSDGQLCAIVRAESTTTWRPLLVIAPEHRS